jgi:hypothetical protein
VLLLLLLIAAVAAAVVLPGDTQQPAQEGTAEMSGLRAGRLLGGRTGHNTVLERPKQFWVFSFNLAHEGCSQSLLSDPSECVADACCGVPLVQPMTAFYTPGDNSSAQG